MTQANGKLALSTVVPMLGNVVGTRTMQELAAGTVAEPPDAPAVVTKPIAKKN